MKKMTLFFVLMCSRALFCSFGNQRNGSYPFEDEWRETRARKSTNEYLSGDFMDSPVLEVINSSNKKLSNAAQRGDLKDVEQRIKNKKFLLLELRHAQAVARGFFHPPFELGDLFKRDHCYNILHEEVKKMGQAKSG